MPHFSNTVTWKVSYVISDIDQNVSIHISYRSNWLIRRSSQHRLRQWLVAWWHQAITWTIADFSLVRFCGIHVEAISQLQANLLFSVTILNTTLLKLLPHFTETNELMNGWTMLLTQIHIPSRPRITWFGGPTCHDSKCFYFLSFLDIETLQVDDFLFQCRQEYPFCTHSIAWLPMT